MTDSIVTPENLLKAHEIAVEAKVKTDSHIQDCTMFRLRLAEDFRDVKETMRSNRSDAMSESRELRGDLKKQTWILALIMGGIIAVSKLPDLLNFLHR